jgi:hypothetical protein
MEQTWQTPQDSELSVNEILLQEERFAKWQGRRPKIEHLLSGVIVDPEDGSVVPLFDVGQRIVVDRCTPLLEGSPWLETMVGKVTSIDDETGLVTMLDEDPYNQYNRYVNYKNPLHTFKLAPPSGDPFDQVAPQPQKPTKDPNKKTGRGRPSGSKNRSKDVIKAEKEARRAEREAKRAAKKRRS